MRLRSSLVRFVIAAAAVVPVASLAQDAAPASSPPAAAEPSLPTIEEIVVTAQKRAQSVQDVPISIAAIGGSEIDDLKITDTNDIAGLVPNLQVNQVIGDGAPVFSLRGVTMNDYSVHQSSPVAVYTDEVYAGPSVLQPIQMFDLDRIEVLRGPQGTLYGRNSTGGAVNLITRAPSFENGTYLTGGIGNFHRLEMRGAGEMTLVEDVLAVRLAGFWTDADGWFENKSPGIPDGNSMDEWAVRLSALWRPTDGVEVIARYSAGRSNPENYGILADHINQIGDPANGVGVGGGVFTLFNSLGGANPPDYFRTGLGKYQWESDKIRLRKRDVDQASLHVSWDVTEKLTLTSITAWVQGDLVNPEDSDGSPIRAIEVDYLGDGDQISQELRLTSDLDGPFDFVAGLYYAREKLHIESDLLAFSGVDFNLNGGLDPNDCLDPYLAAGDYDPNTIPVTDPLPAPSPSPDGQDADSDLDELGVGLRLRDFVGLGCTYRNSFDQDRRSIAGFFDGTFDVGPSTTLLFGFRVTNDVTEATNFHTFAEGAGVNLFDTIPSTSDKIDDTEYNWKAGVEQRFGEDVLAYFNYSRGYRSGAFNGQAFFDPSEFNQVKPETLDSVELGAKSTLASGRLQLNGALFFYIYKQQQLIDVNPSTGAQTLVNIDRSEVLGFELEGIAQLTEGWRLSGGVGFLDGEAKQGIVSTISVAGDTLPNSPDWSATLASDLDVWSWSAGTLNLHLDANYVGAQYFTLPHDPRTRVSSYVLFDMRIGFEAGSERWDAGFWVKNLGNKFYKTDVISLAGFGLDYTHIGPPRTFGGDFTIHF
jgi:iron complex outermembrane receptor protein